MCAQLDCASSARIPPGSDSLRGRSLHSQDANKYIAPESAPRVFSDYRATRLMTRQARPMVGGWRKPQMGEYFASGPCSAQLNAIHRISAALFARADVET